MSKIKFVGLIGLLGNSYLQFKIGTEFYIYKFSCETIAQRIKYITKFSAGKALDQAKKKKTHWWKQETEWNGWTPEGGHQMDVGPDTWKYKPVTIAEAKEEQLEWKLSM